MKNTMSKRNIAKFHRLLKNGAPMKDCGAILKVTPDTLKKFTPGKVQDFKVKQKEAEKLAEIQKAEEVQAADTLVEAAKKIQKDAKKSAAKPAAKKPAAKTEDKKED